MVLNTLIFLAMLLAVGIALVTLVCRLMARVLLSPPRMTDGRAAWILKRLSPSDLGMGFEEVSFSVHEEKTRQKLKIAAWWIPTGLSARTVVIVHGYADAKVGGIAWAPTFRAMGYNVLAIDLRAHGESEGTQTTAGYFERHDLSQVIDQVRLTRPAATREVVLFGVSLGAAVVGATAAMRTDIAAVIMDCPYSDYVTAAKTHARANGMPGPFFQRIAIGWAEKLSGADFGACSPVKVIPALVCPLMVIHGADDLFVDTVDMDAVEAAVKSRPAELGPTVYWRADGTHHVSALRTDSGEFTRRIEAFLNDARAAKTETDGLAVQPLTEN
jgi:pimeloyl-ACP methyl ester carboxylesterase